MSYFQSGCCDSYIKKMIPEGDNRERRVCTKCNTIFYDNPRIVTGIVPLHKNQVLLCKRAIEPRHGYWTIPAGFMELNETLKEAALREAYEEAGIEPEIKELHTIYDVPHLGQVHFFFIGECKSKHHVPGIETLESQWVDLDALDQYELAFSSVNFALSLLHNTNRPHYGAYIKKES